VVRKTSLSLALAATLVASSFALGRAVQHDPVDAAWPSDAARLSASAAEYPASFGHRRVLIDPGHGAPGNTGNRSAYCIDEQDFTLELAEDLKRRLEETGHFEVRLSRSRGQLVPYSDRVRQAEEWNAEVLLSLHSDVRGRRESWQPSPGRSCSRSHDAPGFSVLWSDSGDPPLVGSRVALARALSSELSASGFLAYRGVEYAGDYEADERPGVFVDRHAENERIFVLWRPEIPSVIIETHNALDDREARRWRETETQEAFASAVTRALVVHLSPPPS